jgi:hypothetical protein
LSFSHRWLQLAIASDDIRSGFARDLDVSAGLRFSW